APGELWQPEGGNTVRTVRSTNSTSEVRLLQEDGSSNSYYNENELLKVEVTDGDGHKRQVFKDKFDRTVLIKVQLDEVIDGTLVPWLETYYTYDVQGRVKFIISPAGVAALKLASWSLNADIRTK